MKFQEKKFPSPQIAIDSGSDKYLLFSCQCKHHFTCLGDHDHVFCSHGYQKKKINSSRFVMCPLLAPHF